MSDDKTSKFSSTRRKKFSTEQSQLEDLFKAREYLDLAEVMFIALGSDGAVEFVNRKCCEVLGYDHDEVNGKDWFKTFIPKRFRKKVHRTFTSLMKGNIEPVKYIENPILTKDGEERIIAWHNTVMKNSDGRIDGILSSGEDITERRRAEEALRESKALLNTTGQMAKVGGWTVDAKSQEVSWTEETYRIHEVPLDQKPPLEDAINFFHPDEREKLAIAIQRALDHGESYDMELRFITAKGKKLWTHTICKPQVVNGKTVKLMGTFQDITERKLAEEELRKLGMVAEQASDGIAVANLDGVIEYINRAWTEMHGYGNPKELIGKSLSIFHTKEQLEQDVIPFNEKFKERGTYQGEVGHKRKDGTTFPTFMNNSILKDNEGNPIALLGMVRDITERKRAERAIQRSEERFRSIFEESPIGIDVFDSDGILIEANRACLDVFGVSLDDLRGFLLFDDPNIPEKAKKKLKAGETVRYQAPFDFEKVKELGSYKTSRSGIAYLNTVITPFGSGKDGGSSGYIVQMQDVSERKIVEEALRKSKQRYQDLLMSLPEGVGITDLNENFTYVNQAFADLLGYSMEELVQKNVFDLTLAEDHRVVRAETERRKHHAASTYELQMIRKDGELRLIEVSTRPQKDNEGNVIGTIGVLSDITERKRAEEALRESEERARTIFDSVKSGIVIIDVETQTINDANLAALQMMGIKRDELIGTVCHEYLCPAEMGKCPILDLGKTVDNSERILRTVDGVEIPVLKTVSRVTLGEREYLLESFVDISERKKAEMTLQAITDSTLDAIIMVDQEQQIIFWNPAAEKLFGYSNQEIIGRFIHEAIAPGEYSEAAAKGFEKFRTTGRGPAIGKVTELSGRRKDGTKFPIELSLAPIPIGKMWGAVGSIRDITERKQNEEQRRQQHSELEVYTSLLRHDLRNDVGVILGNVDLAKMIAGENDSEILETLSSTEAVCERMMNLLKAVSRSADSVERNIIALVRNVSSQAQDAHAKLTVNVTVDDDAEEIAIVGSRLLPMVFENLLRNAAAHAGEKPIVDMIISQERSNVQVLVTDNGPGIPEEVRSQLFHRGVSTSGGGLGLYLSKAIVNAMNGSIELMDINPDEGATFRILLPLTV